MEILGGPLFAVAGAGESHGPAITTLIFGCPPGLSLSRHAVQQYLDRRRPGSNKHGTPRHEGDKIIWLAGLSNEDTDSLTSGPAIHVIAGDGQEMMETVTTSYEAGYTTGEPLAAMVLSTAKKSEHYRQFQGETGAVRPGHVDLVKHYKTQGFVDVRGGGRASYRSTISDVIGGSVARLYLQQHFGTVFLSSIVQVGPLAATHSLIAHCDSLTQTYAGQGIPAAEIDAIAQRLSAAELHAFDTEFVEQAAVLIKETRMQGDSVGAVVEVVGLQVPPLLGDPLYQSLKLRLMGTLGGLHAVQACEVGTGKSAASYQGSGYNDPIRHSGYQSNHHGGLLGGITTGMPLAFRVSFKPTATIAQRQQSVQKNLEEIDFTLEKGRHDPCVGVRAGVTLESRMAIEVMNSVLMHQAQRVDVGQFRLF